MADGSLKLVLLIDVTACRNGQASYHLQCLDLGLLRILAYLNHVCLSNGKELHWGYKFYSCDESSSGYEKRQFVDLSLKHWEKFEEILWRKCSQSTTNPRQTFLHNKTYAKYLNQALSEVTIYFPWNQPDLVSPIQLNHRYTKSNSQQVIHGLANLILIVRPCPLTWPAVHEFFGKQYTSITAELLEENLLTDVLHQKLTQTLGIGLGWIDVNSWSLKTTNASVRHCYLILPSCKYRNITIWKLNSC